MKTTLLIFVLGLSLAFLSCKKDDPTDPRDKYIGIWSGTEVRYYTDYGTSQNVDQIFEITKGINKSQIVLTNVEGTLVFTATVNNSGHEYDQKIYYDYSTGFELLNNQTGNGTINENQITDYGDILQTASGTDYYIVWTRTLNKIVKK